MVFAILFAAGLNSSQAQGTWTQKADFGGTGRISAIGFSINNKGYIGTGYATDGYKKDFWEYDPDLDVWTQKADFGGIARYFAVGFSIGNKGYAGTGVNVYDNLKDFWEYNPDLNTWTQKADFGGGSRFGAVGFSMDGKGYVGTGNYDDNYSNGEFNDFWEYDPELDVWTQKASFGGTHRWQAIGFSIGNKGYLGTGFLDYDDFRDFWQYDPESNTWTKKSNYGGGYCSGAVCFSIGNRGYVGTGSGTHDFWEYDPELNVWIEKADFGGTGRSYAVGFSIGSKGFIGTGSDMQDFWEYTPDILSCGVPTNLSVTNITSSSAKLKWDAVAGAEKYKVRYKVAGTTNWTKKGSGDNSKPISGLSPNTKYKWEVKTYCQTDSPGVTSDWSAKQEFTTAPERTGDEVVQQVSFQIYPNPAEDHATIQFTLPYASHVYIKVYDVSGKEIEVLLDAELQEGEHSLQLNTNQFSKGVYNVRMVGDFGTVNQKLIVQ